MRSSFCKCNNLSQIKTIGTKNNFQIKTCVVCGHGFVSNDISTEFLEDYYSKARQKEDFKQDLSRQNFPGSKSDAIKFIKLFYKFKNDISTFLEVGAGWGYASEYAFKKGWNISAIEFSDNCLLSIKERTSENADIQKVSFEEFTPKIQQSFDAILMSQVLEHAIDPINWLLKANKLLNDDGLLLVAVPQYEGFYKFFGLKDPFICPPEHLNFFTKKSLLIALKKSGFKVLLQKGFSRIPFFRIWKTKIKNKFIARVIYEITKIILFFADKAGFSMIQYVVASKI